MKEETKTILVKKELHTKLKKYSELTGIKIKILVESAIIDYMKKIKIHNKEC